MYTLQRLYISYVSTLETCEFDVYFHMMINPEYQSNDDDSLIVGKVE